MKLSSEDLERIAKYRTVSQRPEGLYSPSGWEHVQKVALEKSLF